MQDSGEQHEPERVEIGNDQDSLLNEIITREEVKQALDSLKQRAAPGRDGLTTEMVSSEGLMVFWWELFNWCWSGMIPSEWRRSIIVPVPKKRSRGTGVCVTDDFRGISLTSVAYKAKCAIVQVRLEQVVEGGQLLAEKQGGFRKGRGCRDQIVTLIGSN